jgi:hypothetical protein
VIKPPESILTQVNSANAPLARQIAKQQFYRKDMANERLLNEAIRKSVKAPGRQCRRRSTTSSCRSARRRPVPSRV